MTLVLMSPHSSDDCNGPAQESLGSCRSDNQVVVICQGFGGVLITLIISVLGWSLVQQYNANETQLKLV